MRKKDSVDGMTDRLENAAANAMEGLLEPVRRLVASSESYQDILDGLDAMFPEMDNEDFQRVLGDALEAAERAGKIFWRIVEPSPDRKPMQGIPIRILENAAWRAENARR